MKFMCTISAAALALSATSTLAEDAAPQKTTRFEAPAVTFIEAAELAQASAPGTLVALDFFDEDPETRMYYAQLEGETSKSLVLIDADAGDIELTSITQASSAERLEDYERLMGAHADMAGYEEDLKMLELMCADGVIDANEAKLFHGDDLDDEDSLDLGDGFCDDEIAGDPKPKKG